MMRLVFAGVLASLCVQCWSHRTDFDNYEFGRGGKKLEAITNGEKHSKPHDNQHSAPKDHVDSTNTSTPKTPKRKRPIIPTAKEPSFPPQMEFDANSETIPTFFETTPNYDNTIVSTNPHQVDLEPVDADVAAHVDNSSKVQTSAVHKHRDDNGAPVSDALNGLRELQGHHEHVDPINAAQFLINIVTVQKGFRQYYNDFLSKKDALNGGHNGKQEHNGNHGKQSETPTTVTQHQHPTVQNKTVKAKSTSSISPQIINNVTTQKTPHREKRLEIPTAQEPTFPPQTDTAIPAATFQHLIANSLTIEDGIVHTNPNPVNFVPTNGTDSNHTDIPVLNQTQGTVLNPTDGTFENHIHKPILVQASAENVISKSSGTTVKNKKKEVKPAHLVQIGTINAGSEEINLTHISSLTRDKLESFMAVSPELRSLLERSVHPESESTVKYMVVNAQDHPHSHHGPHLHV